MRGKTVLTEISTNSRPIGLIFGTQPPWLHLGGDGYNGYDYDGICYDHSELMAVSATNTKPNWCVCNNWAKFSHTSNHSLCVALETSDAT